MDASIIQRFLRAFTKDQYPNELLILASRSADDRRTYRRFPCHQTPVSSMWALTESEAHRDVYFKTALLQPDQTRMVKEAFQTKALWLWADIDEGQIPPQLEPTFLVESSPGRLQALWRLETRQPIAECEGWCKGIAQACGADPSGWDIGQELRVPGTHNYKYDPAPEVRVLAFNGSRLWTFERLAECGITPVSVTTVSAIDTEAPEPWPGPAPWYTVIAAGKHKRSVALWGALCHLRDDGWDKQDAYRLMWWSPMNKYRIDGRAPRDLWRDVEKCWQESPPESVVVVATPAPKMEQQESIRHWPALCERAIEWIRPGVLFNDEVIGLSFLSALSVGFPRLRVHNMNVALWVLILGSQASGKSTVIGQFTDLMRAAIPNLQVATSGSPEGLMERVSQGPTLISLEEYSEQLKHARQADSYAATNKEVFLRIFDGRPFEHATRKNPIQSTGGVYATMLAATNADTWRRLGNPEDMANGYLSRFIVVAADLQDRSVSHTEMARGLELMVPLVRERVNRGIYLTKSVLSSIAPVAGLGLQAMYGGFEISSGELTMLDYQRVLEDRWEKQFNLDEPAEGSAYSIPPGRTMMKAKKMAVLLELCEKKPQIAGDTIHVRDSNSLLAVQLAGMSQEWAQRAIGWLSLSEDTEYADKILKLLKKAAPEWVPPWDIASSIRGLRTGAVRQLLTTLGDSGLVERQVVQGKNKQNRELWRIVSDTES